MLAKIAAVLILIGLLLPYPGKALLFDVWRELAPAAMVGIPFVMAFGYAVRTFVPPIARFHERHGARFHRVGLAIYFMLVGAYVRNWLLSEGGGLLIPALALGVSGGLVWFQGGRGTEGQRLPLLLLACALLAVIPHWEMGPLTVFMSPPTAVLTIGLLLAAIAEVLRLRRAAPPAL